jgi:hypothetical protein
MKPIFPRHMQAEVRMRPIFSRREQTVGEAYYARQKIE